MRASPYRIILYCITLQIIPLFLIIRTVWHNHTDFRPLFVFLLIPFERRINKIILIKIRRRFLQLIHIINLYQLVSISIIELITIEYLIDLNYDLLILIVLIIYRFIYGTFHYITPSIHYISSYLFMKQVRIIIFLDQR